MINVNFHDSYMNNVCTVITIHYRHPELAFIDLFVYNTSI